MQRLRRRFPHALVLAFDSPVTATGAPRGPVPAGRSAHDVTLDFVTAVRGSAASAAEAALLATACDACGDDTTADGGSVTTGDDAAGDLGESA